MEDDTRKQHRQRHAGPKADKKKAKIKHEQELTDKQRNPKAFAYHSVNKVAKAVRRTLDIQSKKHHIPVVDRTPIEPPPIVVVVVGPPKVGKTTLINCLIRNFTRQKLSTIQGPVTIVSGKKKRLTIIECNNDINCMIDLAKIADLVLLLVDASFGFEMETFEFLNICQVHGFPKIMGVLTHLDMFRNTKLLRKTKKRLKHRFWTEIYQGAKLFYLSGMVNGEYQKTEVHNLGRFISVMKFRPLQWRTTHPYLLADRMEDLTDPEMIRRHPKCDRNVCLYGYCRGIHFKNNSSIHIPGAGDYQIKDISFLPDPCPLPDKEKKRSLNEKERLIYAPMSGVGGIVYDKDAVYIDLGGSHSHNVTEEAITGRTNKLVSTLISSQHTFDSKMATSQMSIFKDAQPLTSKEVDNSVLNELSEETVIEDTGRVRRKAVFDKGDDVDEDDNDDDDDDESGYSEEEEGSGDEENENDNDSDNAPSTTKKAKVEIPVEHVLFADSDDDLENEINVFSSQKINKLKTKINVDNINIKKSKKLVKIQSNVDEDSSDEDEEKVENVNQSNQEVIADAELESESQSDEISDDAADSHTKSKHIEIIGAKKSYSKLSRRGSNSTALSCNNKKKSRAVATISEKSGRDNTDSDEDTYDGSSNDSESDDSAMKEDDLDENDTQMPDTDAEDEDQEMGFLKWKENLAQKASSAFLQRQRTTPNLRKLVYGKVAEVSDSESDSEEVGGLFRINKKNINKSTVNGFDCSKFMAGDLQDWNMEEVMDSIRDCFVTGKWDKSEDAKALLEQDDELYGDFEDLETGNVHKNDGSDDSDNDEASDVDEKESDQEDKDEGENLPQKAKKLTREERAKRAMEKRTAKKRRLKEMFDQEYDEATGGEAKATYFDDLKQEMDQQAQLNRSEFETMDDETRVQYEGFRPGMYVRVEVEKIPCEFVTNFDSTYPVILGGLLSAEDSIGYVQVRLKKHRWHKKILKTRDPIIISLGWRRFQTIPMFSIQDHNMRHRLLKYTPEHMHCHATWWGPITPQGAGFLAVQNISSRTPDFRIAATGVVLELDKSKTVVKKLKLTGTPYKIYKKTAFIKGMFNSQLEVARFEGANIRSVSGIRGQIKKAVKTPEGCFRATFEDKLLLSDIVFVRTWYAVQVPKFYNPVTTLLLPQDQKSQWSGMKTTGQLRRELGIKASFNQDSLYKPVARKQRVFNPLVIPKDLQRNLPFKDKPKIARKYADPVQSKRVAIVQEPHEKKVSQLMKMMKTVYENKMKKRHTEMRQRAQKHERDVGKIEAKRTQKQKEVKKQIFRVLGQIEKKKARHQKD